MLLVPLYAQSGHAIGVLEFHHRTIRRWAVRDITVARMLAEHVAQALARLDPLLRRPVPRRPLSRRFRPARLRAGRSGSADQADHEPGYSAASIPIEASATTSWAAVIPEPQYTATGSPARAPRAP